MMPRYIDAELFAKKLTMEIYLADDEDFTKAFVRGMELVKKAENETPTADVVPRSEIESLQAQIAQLQLDLHYSVCREDEAVARTSREIFAEIYEDCFDQFGYINYEALAELKKKYIGE